jgi:glutamine amidotransferase
MSARILVIDYGSGNLRSVVKAASHIILPGVGAFADCSSGLLALPGMHEALSRAVLEEKRWFLGICVGMQLLADLGHEHGKHQGLGWIGGEVKPIPQNLSLKIPHMGWNSLSFKDKENPLFRGLGDQTDMYFVHSYYFSPTDRESILATTNYGVEIPAIIAKENITGVQFHPEKSQKSGLRFLSNFMRRNA